MTSSSKQNPVNGQQPVTSPHCHISLINIYTIIAEMRTDQKNNDCGWLLEHRSIQYESPNHLGGSDVANTHEPFSLTWGKPG